MKIIYRRKKAMDVFSIKPLSKSFQKSEYVSAAYIDDLQQRKSATDMKDPSSDPVTLAKQLTALSSLNPSFAISDDRSIIGGWVDTVLSKLGSFNSRTPDYDYSYLGLARDVAAPFVTAGVMFAFGRALIRGFQVAHGRIIWHDRGAKISPLTYARCAFSAVLAAVPVSLIANVCAWWGAAVAVVITTRSIQGRAAPLVLPGEVFTHSLSFAPGNGKPSFQALAPPLPDSAVYTPPRDRVSAAVAQHTLSPFGVPLVAVDREALDAAHGDVRLAKRVFGFAPPSVVGAAVAGCAVALTLTTTCRLAVAICRGNRLVLPSEYLVVTEPSFFAKVAAVCIPAAVAVERGSYFATTEFLKYRIRNNLNYMLQSNGNLIDVRDTQAPMLRAVEAAGSIFLPLQYLRLFMPSVRDRLMISIENPSDPRLSVDAYIPYRRRCLQRDVEDRQMLAEVRAAYERLLTPVPREVSLDTTTSSWFGRVW